MKKCVEGGRSKEGEEVSEDFGRRETEGERSLMDKLPTSGGHPHEREGEKKENKRERGRRRGRRRGRKKGKGGTMRQGEGGEQEGEREEEREEDRKTGEKRNDAAGRRRRTRGK